MRVWLRQHRQAFGAALRKLAAQKAAALLNALVIGIALSLPAGGYALLSSVQAVTRRASLEPQLSVYLHNEAKRAESDALAGRLKGDGRVREVRFVPRERALAELQKKGMQFDAMPPSEREAMRKATAGVVDDIKKRVGAPLVDQVLAEVKKAGG